MTRRQDVEEAIYVYSDSDNTDTVLLKPYQEYVSRAQREVTTLKNIVPDVQHVDQLEGEIMQKDFIEAFKALVRTITTLKSFIEFRFTEDEIGLSEQEYMDYRSKYLDLNRMVSQSDKATILNDISFDLELLATDTIDVDYILNLLKSINYDNVIQKEVDIDKVRDILNQNDTEAMHSKIELIRKFLDEASGTLTNDDDIEMRYEAFVEGEKEKAILQVAETMDVPYEDLKHLIADYQFSNVMPNALIRDKIQGKFIEKRNKMDQIRTFIIEVTENY
jgi:type I restriction enzyme R subunit